jgi:hypothetical protein
MNNQTLILIFSITQLLGIRFYFDNIDKARTRFEKFKIFLLSAYPAIVIINLLIYPID